jgi:hypothetical protein
VEPPGKATDGKGLSRCKYSGVRKGTYNRKAVCALLNC